MVFSVYFEKIQFLETRSHRWSLLASTQGSLQNGIIRVSRSAVGWKLPHRGSFCRGTRISGRRDIWATLWLRKRAHRISTKECLPIQSTERHSPTRLRWTKTAARVTFGPPLMVLKSVGGDISVFWKKLIFENSVAPPMCYDSDTWVFPKDNNSRFRSCLLAKIEALVQLDIGATFGHRVCCPSVSSDGTRTLFEERRRKSVIVFHKLHPISFSEWIGTDRLNISGQERQSFGNLFVFFMCYLRGLLLEFWLHEHFGFSQGSFQFQFRLPLS